MSFYKPSRILYLTVGMMLLSSCGGLNRAEEFGKLHEKLENSFVSLSNDIYLSCIRRANYPTGFFPAIVKRRTLDDEICNKEYKPRSDKVNNVNLILMGYVKGIGTLATNRPGFFRPSIDNLNTTLTDLNSNLSSLGATIDTRFIDSGFNILNVVADIFTTSFRSRNIKTAIVCTEPDIQAYIPGLQEIITQGYIPLLNDERSTINRYFNDFKQERLPQNLTEIESSHRLTQSYNQAINENIDKISAAEAYIDILRATATAHSELSKEFLGDTPRKSDKIKNKCDKFFAEGKKLRFEIEKKVMKSDTEAEPLTNNEKAAINRVLIKYYIKVQSLAKNMDKAYEN